MTMWPPEPGARTVIYYTARANLLRRQMRTEFMAQIVNASLRYAVAPFAFARRKCSSSRGNISTKLHGR
jgi:hypothetical protein